MSAGTNPSLLPLQMDTQAVLFVHYYSPIRASSRNLMCTNIYNSCNHPQLRIQRSIHPSILYIFQTNPTNHWTPLLYYPYHVPLAILLFGYPFTYSIHPSPLSFCRPPPHLKSHFTCFTRPLFVHPSEYLRLFFLPLVYNGITGGETKVQKQQRKQQH